LYLRGHELQIFVSVLVNDWETISYRTEFTRAHDNRIRMPTGWGSLETVIATQASIEHVFENAPNVQIIAILSGDTIPIRAPIELINLERKSHFMMHAREKKSILDLGLTVFKSSDCLQSHANFVLSREHALLIKDTDLRRYFPGRSAYQYERVATHGKFKSVLSGADEIVIPTLLAYLLRKDGERIERVVNNCSLLDYTVPVSSEGHELDNFLHMKLWDSLDTQEKYHEDFSENERTFTKTFREYLITKGATDWSTHVFLFFRKVGPAVDLTRDRLLPWLSARIQVPHKVRVLFIWGLQRKSNVNLMEISWKSHVNS